MKKIDKLEPIDPKNDYIGLDLGARDKINEIIAVINEMKETSNILFTLRQQK